MVIFCSWTRWFDVLWTRREVKVLSSEIIASRKASSPLSIGCFLIVSDLEREAIVERKVSTCQ
jgi:hypothetical protein